MSSAKPGLKLSGKKTKTGRLKGSKGTIEEQKEKPDPKRGTIEPNRTRERLEIAQDSSKNDQIDQCQITSLAFRRSKQF